MLIVDILIDAMVNNGILTFMVGYSSNNQIYLAVEDFHKTVFHCPGSIGIFEWVVMPFGLKNVGATYQRAMNLKFHDIIDKNMKVYIDGIIVKLANFKQHSTNLEQSIMRIQ